MPYLISTTTFVIINIQQIVYNPLLCILKTVVLKIFFNLSKRTKRELSQEFVLFEDLRAQHFNNSLTK